MFSNYNSVCPSHTRRTTHSTTPTKLIPCTNYTTLPHVTLEVQQHWHRVFHLQGWWFSMFWRTVMPSSLATNKSINIIMDTLTLKNRNGTFLQNIKIQPRKLTSTKVSTTRTFLSGIQHVDEIHFLKHHKVWFKLFVKCWLHWTEESKCNCDATSEHRDWWTQPTHYKSIWCTLCKQCIYQCWLKYNTWYFHFPNAN
jgi:hypothetical protein